jgi:hypothetical protein
MEVRVFMQYDILYTIYELRHDLSLQQRNPHILQNVTPAHHRPFNRTVNTITPCYLYCHAISHFYVSSKNFAFRRVFQAFANSYTG